MGRTDGNKVVEKEKKRVGERRGREREGAA